MKNKSKSTTVRAAIYARVSSEQQAQQSTIASQVAALRERIHADGLSLEDDLCFLDDGFSGSTLVRPGLERLRDVAWAGGFTRLYVHSPDRLARKYAWQVLLVEELQRCGIEIIFLNRTIGVSPEEDLLLQMQGMIAEYERAKIMERSRRGKRHAARSGSVNVLCGAPYGYRYITKHAGGGQAQYQVVLEEARVVRQIFEWVGRDRLSLRAVERRLRQQGVPSAKGMTWHAFTIRKLLTNPAYKGEAIFGKTRVGERRPRLRPSRGQPEQPRSHTSRYPGAIEDQIPIHVPALVSAELFAAVAEQLAENRRHYRQQSQSPGYLLQGLLVCDGCGYGWYGKGITRFTKNDQAPYPYYRCIGMDAFRFGGTKVCSHRPIRLDRLDAAVWADVCQLLQNPKALREEFERRINGDREPNIDVAQIHKQIKSVQRGISRLIDAYEDGLLEKGEFEPRVARARERLARLKQEATTAQDHAAQQKELRLVLGQLEDFAAEVRRGLDKADFAKRREIVRCLVKTIKIEEEHVRITYRVSPRPFAKAPSGGPFRHHCHRRVERGVRRLAAGAGPEALRRHRFDHLLAVHRFAVLAQDLGGGVDGAELLRLGGGLGLGLGGLRGLGLRGLVGGVRRGLGLRGLLLRHVASPCTGFRKSASRPSRCQRQDSQLPRVPPHSKRSSSRFLKVFRGAE
jgi:site-specific DNA recombinase